MKEGTTLRVCSAFSRLLGLDGVWVRSVSFQHDRVRAERGVVSSSPALPEVLVLHGVIARTSSITTRSGAIWISAVGAWRFTPGCGGCAVLSTACMSRASRSGSGTTAVRCRAVGPPVDHDRHLARGARPGSTATDGGEVPVLSPGGLGMRAARRRDSSPEPPLPAAPATERHSTRVRVRTGAAHHAEIYRQQPRHPVEGMPREDDDA